MISVDLPGGPGGGGYAQWRIPLYKSFALPNQQIHLIRADSHHRGTLEQVEAILGGEQIDFLFIDGDHSYEGVKMDFEMHSPLVKKGGLIAFHDVAVQPPETGCEVNRFWNEIKRKYEYIEIVENWDQKEAGIGLLFTT
jgi:predicted O-methyltransferase YrrM